MQLTQKQYQKLEKHLEKYIYTKILQVLLKMAFTDLNTHRATFNKVQEQVFLTTYCQFYLFLR